MTDLSPALRKLRLTEPEASAYLAEGYGLTIAPATLRTWRCRCPEHGPPFERFGRAIVYRRLAVDAWAQARLTPAFQSKGDDHAA